MSVFWPRDFSLFIFSFIPLYLSLVNILTIKTGQSEVSSIPIRYILKQFEIRTL